MKKPILFLAAAVIGLSAAPAQPVSDQASVLQDIPAAAVDNVIVPVPSEVFIVLDKLGSPNWRGQLRDSMGKNTGNRAQVALLLGTVIADGFIAVQAQDPEKVKDIGRDVLNLASAINVRDAVITRSKSIVDKAEKRNWPDVRREFDGALQDVKGAMRELDDEDLAQLVSLGGWIRGTQVLTSLIGQEYRQDKAELLHQPQLVAFFTRRIDSMPKKLQKDPLIVQIRKTLPKISPLLGTDDGSKISQEDVKKINQLSSELVMSISQPKR